MTVSNFTVTILVGLFLLWVLGGVLLRSGGLLLVVVGGFVLGLQRDATGIFVLAPGALLWLAGHWHYALRHHEYKSPLAGYVFLCWTPGWLDPTRDWAVPVAESDGADSEGRFI
jgi:hypothetical protein